MDAGFWRQRWQEGRIGFHQDRPTPLMAQHWDALGVAPGARVLVPLCGKSLDMAWLASRGYRVLGVELSELAIEQFLAEQRLTPDVHGSSSGRHFVAGPIELLQGDAFALEPALLAECDAVYDRAALIALPADLRRRYRDAVYSRLPTGCDGLLVTLEYPQHEKQGPPFSVGDEEVHELFAGDWTVESLARLDILAQQPGFAAEGVTALHTAAWRLRRR